MLNLYIARRFTATLALILAAVAVVIFLADYVEVLRRFSDDDGFTALLGLQLAAMRVPFLLDTALPFAFLFAALLSLLGLSRKLELVVARASGVSVWGFLRAPFAVALLFGAARHDVPQPARGRPEGEGRTDGGGALGRSARGTRASWFRQESDAGPSIVYAGSASDDGLALFGVTAFVFDAAGEFREKVTAPRADHTTGPLDPDRCLGRARAERPAADASATSLPTDLTAAELSRSFIEPEAISVWSLPGFIDTAERTGLDPDRFRVASTP